MLPLFFFLIQTNDTLADIALRHVSYRISHISDTDDACDMIWLTSIGSQQHEQKRYLYTHYTVDIVGVFDSLWSLNTHKGNGWMATGKMRKTISNSVGIHQLGNCARVHSHAISIEDIDFFCFFFCFVFRAIAFLMGSFLPLEFSLSHPFALNLSSFQAFGRIFVSIHFQRMETLFPWYYIIATRVFEWVRERSTFCNAITYWLWTRDNRSLCSKIKWLSSMSNVIEANRNGSRWRITDAAAATAAAASDSVVGVYDTCNQT